LTKSHRLRVLAAFGPAILTAAGVFASVSASSAFAGSATAQPEGEALFTTQGSVAPQFLAGATTIPHWTFQYTDPTNGVTYPITMAGTDPRQGGSTTVHTVLIPLKMNFVAAGQDPSSLVNQGYAGFQPQFVNHTFDGTNKLSQTEASPVFNGKVTYPTDLGGDTGQLGDVYMRAQFNKIASSYHVKLDYTVAPTQTLDVPATKGIAYERPVSQWRRTQQPPLQTTADYTGLADINWFSTQLQSLMGSLQISATTVPIFLTDNVLLYFPNTSIGYQNCCVLGYHGAAMPVGRGTGTINGQGKQQVQTFMYTAYVTPGTYSGFLSDYTGTRAAPRPTRGLSDIHALSHEVSEWLDDPYTNNAVQPWQVASAPQYGCTRVLEVGDPVVGVWFGLNGNNLDARNSGLWHPEDEVFAQWFGRGGVEPVLGSSWDGRFTFMGPRTTSIIVGGKNIYSAFSVYAQNC
jgi:hypothetical protein